MQVKLFRASLVLASQVNFSYHILILRPSAGEPRTYILLILLVVMSIIFVILILIVASIVISIVVLLLIMIIIIILSITVTVIMIMIVILMIIVMIIMIITMIIMLPQASLCLAAAPGFGALAACYFLQSGAVKVCANT